MPNLKCKICGTEFPPIRERHYISRDLIKIGLATPFSSFDELPMFDSYDCPCCGSQVIAQPRKCQYDLKSEEATDEELLADMSNETIAEHLGLNPATIGHLRAAQSSSNSSEIFEHLNIIADKFNDIGNPNIIFSQDIEDLVNKMSAPEKKLSSLYFNNPDNAYVALSKMDAVIKENGFISIGEVNKILGGDNYIMAKWGWTDLSKARVIESKNTSHCYISFPPAICDRPASKEASNEL